MVDMENGGRAQWGSKIGFILAAAGSAVGLGNIWKFPGKAFAGGGGAYLVIYLIILLILGIPVMLTELSLGRFTQKNTVGTFRMLNKKFAWSGWAGVLCAFIILCYYSHVGGWVLNYIIAYATDSHALFSTGGLEYFYKFLGFNMITKASFFPTRAIIFAAIFIVLNTFILLKGVSGGIEKFNKVGMPLLFCILIVLLVKTATLPGAREGFKYMLTFNWSTVDGSTIMSALGQAFYSLSLGMAIMITYGSYLGKDVNLPKNTFIICTLDTLVAFISGFIIVPAVFATLGSENVGKGGSFAFAALVGVFKQMPAGAVFGALFFGLLFFAAISSSISIEEGVVAFVCEEWGFDRKKTIYCIAILCFIIGGVYTLSQVAYDIKLPWLDFTGFNMYLAGDWLEIITDRLILPISAFGECLFVGWFWGPANIQYEVCSSGTKFGWYKIYAFLIKYIAPLGIGAIIIYSFVTGTTIS